MKRTPPPLRSQDSAAPGRAQLQAATMELGLEGPGPEVHCHEAAAGVGVGICLAASLHASQQSGARSRQPLRPEIRSPCSSQPLPEGQGRGEGQAGAAALSAARAVVDYVTVPARESSASPQRGGPSRGRGTLLSRQEPRGQVRGKSHHWGKEGQKNHRQTRLRLSLSAFLVPKLPGGAARGSGRSASVEWPRWSAPRSEGHHRGSEALLRGGCRISLSSQAGLAAEKRQVRGLTVPWGWETPPSAA